MRAGKPVWVRFALLCRHLVDELRLCASEHDLLERVGEEGQRGAVWTFKPERLRLRCGLGGGVDWEPLGSWGGGRERQRGDGN